MNQPFDEWVSLVMIIGVRDGPDFLWCGVPGRALILGGESPLCAR